jgi:thermostable 8-oxoguanine DNA glycosylase
MSNYLIRLRSFGWGVVTVQPEELDENLQQAILRYEQQRKKQKARASKVTVDVYRKMPISKAVRDITEEHVLYVLFGNIP